MAIWHLGTLLGHPPSWDAKGRHWHLGTLLGCPPHMQKNCKNFDFWHLGMILGGGGECVLRELQADLSGHTKGSCAAVVGAWQEEPGSLQLAFFPFRSNDQSSAPDHRLGEVSSRFSECLFPS